MLNITQLKEETIMVGRTETSKPAVVINGDTGRVYDSGDFDTLSKRLPELQTHINQKLTPSIGNSLMVEKLPMDQNQIDIVMSTQNLFDIL